MQQGQDSTTLRPLQLTTSHWHCSLSSDSCPGQCQCRSQATSGRCQARPGLPDGEPPEPASEFNLKLLASASEFPSRSRAGHNRFRFNFDLFFWYSVAANFKLLSAENLKLRNPNTGTGMPLAVTVPRRQIHKLAQTRRQTKARLLITLERLDRISG